MRTILAFIFWLAGQAAFNIANALDPDSLRVWLEAYGATIKQKLEELRAHVQ